MSSAGPHCGHCMKLSLYSTAMQKSWVGPWRWLSSPTPLFCVGDTNMLVSKKKRKQIKFAFLPRQNPNANQWNIGALGPWCWVFALGMYILFLLC